MLAPKDIGSGSGVEGSGWCRQQSKKGGSAAVAVGGKQIDVDG
jgi:hypothetical protein